ncbi:cell division cycle- protein, partial [Coemansia pectinata]
MTEHLGSLPFFVRALYPFRSEEASGLTFDRGDIIEVLACLESGWWNGVCGTNRGWFPSNYVEQVSTEQVQILRQAAHLQHQQLPSIPVTAEVASATTTAAAAAVSVAQPADQLATNNDIATRRGSLADAQAGVASAVPSRLRTGRRPSSPHNALPPTSEGEGTAMVSVRSRSDSVDMNGSIVSPRGLSSSSVHTAEAVHVAQWESRVTLDGRTYYCNIFTDKTVWALAAAGGDSGRAGSQGAELIGDEATLVYVSLLMGRNDSGARRDVTGTDLHVLAGSGLSAAG